MTQDALKARAARIGWIEAVRALAIFLVVLGHVIRGLFAAGILPDGAFWSSVDQAIYSFHMPLLFLLSGMFLLRTSDAPAFLTGRLKRLIWPLFLWTYIYFGLKVLAGENQNTVVGFDAFPWFPLPPHLHFWFLWALFLCSAAVWCLRRLQRALTVADAPFWSSILLMSAPLYLFQSENAPEWLAPAIAHLPFVIAGILLPRDFAANVTALLGVGASVALVLLLAYFGVAELYARGWYLLSGMTISVLVCYLLAACEARGTRLPAWVRLVSQASMAIYMAHAVISPMFRIVLLKVGVNSPSIHLVGGVIVGVCLPAIAFRMVRGTRLQAILGW